MTTITQNREQDIKYLNSFLRNELAAVETYGQCIDKVDDEKIAARLADLQDSHQKRASLLSQKILELGGEPDEGPGLWGNFSKMIEGGAKLFGERSAISALEQGEDRGRENYQEKIDKLSPDARSFIGAAILPEHLHSHDMLNRVQAMAR